MEHFEPKSITFQLLLDLLLLCMYVHRVCEGTRVEARGTAAGLLLFYILWVLGIELPSLGFRIKCFTTVKGTDSQSLRLKLSLKTKALVGWSSKLPEGRRAISGGNWHHPKS